MSAWKTKRTSACRCPCRTRSSRRRRRASPSMKRVLHARRARRFVMPAVVGGGAGRPRSASAAASSSARAARGDVDDPGPSACRRSRVDERASLALVRPVEALDREPDVRPVEAADEHVRVAHAEPLDDLRRARAAPRSRSARAPSGGRAPRSRAPRRRYSGRKSWPHSLMQCASSTTNSDASARERARASPRWRAARARGTGTRVARRPARRAPPALAARAASS